MIWHLTYLFISVVFLDTFSFLDMGFFCAFVHVLRHCALVYHDKRL